VKEFSISIQADKPSYPVEFRIKATSWHTAVARALREWRSTKGKGSHSRRLVIVAVQL